MASRRALPEDWKPNQATKLQVKAQPRGEPARLPYSSTPPRVTGLRRVQGEERPIPKAPPPTRHSSSECHYETPPDPEIVDFSTTQPMWPQRRPVLPRVPSRRGVKSPSMLSLCSARQSEISLGILDYYMRTSIDNPTPVPPTPALDSAIEQFDFGLTPVLKLEDPNDPSSTRRKPVAVPKPPPAISDAAPGAEREELLISLAPETILETASDAVREQATPVAPRPHQKGSYGLFPNVQETTPTRNIVKDSPPPTVPLPALTSPTTPVTPLSVVSFTDSFPPPPTNYEPGDRPPMRPRNASLPTSIRSRKDSFTSFHYPNKRIPLRMLSSSTSSSSNNQGSTRSSAPLISSPLDQQQIPPSNKPTPGTFTRWSNETVPVSPTTATSTPPHVRTSFSSLLASTDSRGGSGSGQYPDCFFEDDDEDEAAPLRRKFRWRKGTGSVLEQRQRVRSQGLEESRSAGRSLWMVLFCGCCGKGNVDEIS